MTIRGVSLGVDMRRPRWRVYLPVLVAFVLGALIGAAL
jgi:uncharacterized membrane protein YoaK (UPF0700 family)